MLNDQIKDRILNISGDIGIYYKDIKSGYSIFEGNSDVFLSAGISKLFLLIEVFRQIDEGNIKKSDKYTLKNEDKAPSIGALMSLHEGIELTIEDLYRLMITVGDNSAFNILARMIGLDKINNTLAALGFEHSKVNRLFFDQTEIAKGVGNYFSVTEIGDLFERMYYGQLISGEVSRGLSELLSLQQRDYIIPYHFSDIIPVAHQIGEDDELIHDCGIIYSKNPFILCMGTNRVDVKKAESAMRDIAYICLKFSNKFN